MRRGFADEQERGYPATTAQQIEQTLQNEGSFVGVDDNGKLVGFVSASNRAERDGSRIISMLVVDPALEGKGHAPRNRGVRRKEQLCGSWFEP